MMSPEDKKFINDLGMAEAVRAISRQMIANGQAKISPEAIKAMRKLDKEIDIARSLSKGIKDER